MLDEFTNQIAIQGYEAYAVHSCKDVAGAKPTPWDSLPDSIKLNWYAAADGIVNFMATLKVEKVA